MSDAVFDPLVQITPGGAGGGAPAPEPTLEALEALIRGFERVVVAYSGGVDSSLVLRVAVSALGDRALGVIGRSDSYASRELELALEQARSFGARIEIVTTGELANPAFAANPRNRCYHCKTELYRKLSVVAEREGAVILDGTIHDDLSDWRPGRRAAAEHAVRSPLAELGFTKAAVRRIARALGVESHDKPASPCLASRVPYGTAITRDILGQVERAESLLRELGFRELRVRHHGGVARIEVPVCDLPRAIDEAVRNRLVAGFKEIGYQYLAIDLEGFRSGSLNEARADLHGGEETEGPIPHADRPGSASPNSGRAWQTTHEVGTKPEPVRPGRG